MLPTDDDINKIAGSILKDYHYLFPSTYPDIPLNLTMLKEALNHEGFAPEKNEIPLLMQRVELALTTMVPLNWNNYGSIAILLNYYFPDENLLTISEQKVIELTRQLNNFTDKSQPAEDIIDSLIYTWISLTDEDPGFMPEDPWG